MIRYVWIALFVFACSLVSVAQDSTNTKAPRPDRKDMRPLKDRIWFGGGIGLNFGTTTAIQVDPMVGYKVDQKGKFTTGLGISYRYFQSNFYNPPLSFSAYGYRPFVRYRVIPQVFLHGEFLHMNVLRSYNTLTSDAGSRIWIPHILVGGGYVQSLGGRSSIYFQALFEILQDPNSIYAGRGPVIGGGVGIGF